MRPWRVFPEHIPHGRGVLITSFTFLRPVIHPPGNTWETCRCFMIKIAEGPTHSSSPEMQRHKSQKAGFEITPLNTHVHLFLFKHQLSKFMFDEPTYLPQNSQSPEKNPTHICLLVCSVLADDKKLCACLEKFWTSIVHLLSEWVSRAKFPPNLNR